MIDHVGMEDEVLSCFHALLDALTKDRDADAAIALYAEDDDVMFWGSTEDEIASGPADVAELLRAITVSPTQVTSSWHERPTTVVGDVAWVNAVGQVRVENPGQPLKIAPYRITAVFVRRDGAWRWHTFSGSEPDPPRD